MAQQFYNPATRGNVQLPDYNSTANATKLFSNAIQDNKV